MQTAPKNKFWNQNIRQKIENGDSIKIWKDLKKVLCFFLYFWGIKYSTVSESDFRSIFKKDNVKIRGKLLWSTSKNWQFEEE